MRLLAAALIVPAVAAAMACGSPIPSVAGESKAGGAASLAPAIPATPVPELVLEVVATYPHDPDAFTQGLLWHEGKLFESTGLYGRSSLREVELASGRVLRSVDLDAGHFAEGLALVGDRLFQLSYQNELAWEWDLATFARKREFSYSGEGWGLTYDGADLIQSDGSPRLTFRSTADFSPRRELLVLRAGRPQYYLNELEWVNGEIWSNIWMTDEIVRIDARSGAITGVVDASQLLTAEERRRADVLNGIAWDPERGLFLITGKNWPKLFAVTIRPSAKS